MAGRIKGMIDTIIEECSNGNETLKRLTRTKLIIKGYHPDRWTLESEDDPATIAELELVARDMGVSLRSYL